jgi:hypothetical protein
MLEFLRTVYLAPCGMSCLLWRSFDKDWQANVNNNTRLRNI